MHTHTHTSHARPTTIPSQPSSPAQRRRRPLDAQHRLWCQVPSIVALMPGMPPACGRPETQSEKGGKPTHTDTLTTETHTTHKATLVIHTTCQEQATHSAVHTHTHAYTPTTRTDERNCWLTTERIPRTDFEESFVRILSIGTIHTLFFFRTQMMSSAFT